MSFKPLTPESKERVKDLYQANPLGRDRLYQMFKEKYPDDKTSRRAIYDYMSRTEVHQLSMRPTMKRGIVRPMVTKSLGSVQLDYLDFSFIPWNGFNAVCNAVDIFSKKLFCFSVQRSDRRQHYQSNGNVHQARYEVHILAG